MMKVTAVSNGVVIDHITAGKCMKLYQFLDLDHVDATIALIKNAPSQKMGKKDIIKIDTELELDLDALGYIDPNVTINIVKDGVCVKKMHPQLPERPTNIIQSENPCFPAARPLPQFQTAIQVADALNPKEPFGQRSRRAPYKVPNTIISSSVAAI